MLAEIDLGEPMDVTWLAADSESVWIHGRQEIIRVSTTTNAIVGHVETPSIEYGYMASGLGAVWQADFDGDRVLRIDPETEQVVTEIAVGASPEGVATTPGAVWVANHHAGTVSRIDSDTNRVVATIEVGPSGSNGPLVVAAGPAGVWVHVPNLGRVVHIDPATDTIVGSVSVDGSPAVDGSSVWIEDPAGRGVVRVDPVTSEVIASVPLVPASVSLAFGGIAAGLGSVWVSTQEGLYRIDASTNRVVGLLPVALGDVAIGAGSVWMATYGSGSLLRIAPD